MRLWIDADACPRSVKEIIFRAAERTQTAVVMVANSPMWMPRSALVSFKQVEKILDAADSLIVQESEAGDIVVTQDIPLAALLVDKGVHTLGPRGEEHTAENIRERLSIRDFMQGMRDAGAITGGPREFGDKDKQTFANALDRLLRRTGK